MWLLRLKSGIEVTEQELQCWDNVPADAEIKALAFTIGRDGAAPYVIEYAGYEKYCCARISSAAQGAPGLCVGYSVIAVKNRSVLEHDIFPSGMRLKLYPEDKCETPERCFRRGCV